jgi:hypothetical protein
MCWKRLSGSLRRQRRMIRSSSFGTSATISLGALGGSGRRAASYSLQ